MDGLIDKFKIKDAIYEMRNKKLSDADMEIWHLINELPAGLQQKIPFPKNMTILSKISSRRSLMRSIRTFLMKRELNISTH